MSHVESKTINLQVEYVEGVQRFERIIHASPLFEPWWWLWKPFKGQVSQNHLSVASELAARYEGIIYELISHQNTASAAAIIDLVWLIAGPQCLSLNDPFGFASLLWDVLIREIDLPSSALCLQPKFMLRQFIEEMPSSDARGTLLVCAYDKSAKFVDKSKQTLRTLELAYRNLHAVLTKHEKTLPKLTGGILTPDSLDSSLGRYDEWFFHCS